MGFGHQCCWILGLICWVYSSGSVNWNERRARLGHMVGKIWRRSNLSILARELHGHQRVHMVELSRSVGVEVKYDWRLRLPLHLSSFWCHLLNSGPSYHSAGITGLRLVFSLPLHLLALKLGQRILLTLIVSHFLLKTDHPSSTSSLCGLTVKSLQPVPVICPLHAVYLAKLDSLFWCVLVLAPLCLFALPPLKKSPQSEYEKVPPIF